MLDADPAWRRKVESLLRPLDVDVVLSTDALNHASDAVEGARPDLLFVGVSPATMPEVAALVRASGLHVRSAVIAFGDPVEERLVRSVLAAGARAYLPKSEP